MLEDFRVAKYKIILAAGEKGLILPPYKGSTLRGGFGGVFRRIACAQRNQECRGCMLRHSCPYAYIFETSPAPDAAVLKNLSDIPRPFVIEPPLEDKTHYQPGEELIFHLILIGKAIAYLPYFILVFEELGAVGIGKGRNPYVLKAVKGVRLVGGKECSIYEGKGTMVKNVDVAVSGRELMAVTKTTGRLQVKFVTMTRLKFAMGLVDQVEFHVLLRNMLRRLANLYYFHHGQRLDMDFRACIEQAQSVQLVRQDLRWVDWERFSHRQDAHVNMGGIVGTAAYAGDFTPFLPVLALGETVHVGKGAVFGLGQIRISFI